jgi:hypothetical protein
MKKNEELEEIQSQTQATNRVYFYILPLFERHGISWRVRITLYNTLIHSILIYAVKCGLFPKEPQTRWIPLNGKSCERYSDLLSPMGCEQLRTMMRCIKYTRMWPFQHMFREINVGWPSSNNGKTSYPKEGTSELFWRRKASGETMKYM